MKNRHWVNLKPVAWEPSLNGRSHSRLALTAGSAGGTLTFCLSFANSPKSKCFCWCTVFCVGFCLPSESCKYLLFRKLGSLRTTDKGKRHWDPPESLSRRQTREGKARSIFLWQQGQHMQKHMIPQMPLSSEKFNPGFFKDFKTGKGEGFSYCLWLQGITLGVHIHIYMTF